MRVKKDRRERGDGIYDREEGDGMEGGKEGRGGREKWKVELFSSVLGEVVNVYLVENDDVIVSV